MQLSLLDIMLGREKIPVGYPAALARRIQITDSPLVIYNYQTHPQFWFNLFRIAYKGTQDASITLFQSERQYVQELQGIGTNADLFTQPGNANDGLDTTRPLGKNRGEFLNVWYPPGTVIQMNITGFTAGSGTNKIEVAAIGRYYTPDEKNK